jgi:uncharacterized membrane protein YkvA (DUF1232 family)
VTHGEPKPEAPAAEPSASSRTASGAAGASRGLLSFYDRLRERMLLAAERQSQRYGKPVIEALLLVPDVFILMVRLVLDPAVPGEARALIGGALAYFLLPLDLFPEALVGAAGFLDDLVLGAAVLSQALGGELEPYANKYWNGDRELRQTLRDITQSAQALLGRDLDRRLKRTLARRGIDIED